MQNKNLTKKQHYVPQVYLRGFSQDGKRVYPFDLKTGTSKQTPISIETICYEKYLYEIKDNNGKIISDNYIEKILCILEGQFATYLNKLKSKAFNEVNYKTKCFLTKEEKAFWVSFIAVQMLRIPLVLNTVEKFTTEYFGEDLKENTARTIALNQCLPFFKELKTDDKNVFSMIVKPFTEMTIAVGVDEKESIFTSDKPVYCYVPDNVRGVYETVYFPICRNLVFILFGGVEKEQYDKNRLIKLESEDVINIKKSIAFTAQSWLFSACSFKPDDIKLINEARKDKQIYEQLKSNNFGGSNEQL